MQQDEADEVPEGFVEERRVNHRAAVDRHAPRQDGRAAVRLAVDKVAPAADVPFFRLLVVTKMVRLLL